MLYVLLSAASTLKNIISITVIPKISLKLPKLYMSSLKLLPSIVSFVSLNFLRTRGETYCYVPD